MQHLEEKVLDGTVPEKTPFMIQAVGAETPVLEEPGQTVNGGDKMCQMAARYCTSRVERKGL